MNKNEQLYNLIKSLTPAEKRYFKVFVSAGDKNYLKLFTFIDSQPFFSDEEIKHEFSEEKFVKQLHVTKNYLNKLILKSLRSFNNKISVESQLNDFLKDAEILFRKELYEQCREVVNKIIGVGEKFEKFPQLLAAYEWKRKILIRTAPPLESGKKQDDIINKSINIADKIIAENKFWQLTFDSFGFFTGKYQSTSDYLQNDFLKEKNLPDSLRAKILYYHLRHTLYLREGKFKEALREINDLIQLLENTPERIKDEPSSYITSLNNKITLLLTNKVYNEIPAMLEKIRNVPENYQVEEKNNITIRSIIRTFNVELEMYRDTGNFSAGYRKIKSINEYLELHNEMVSPNYSILLFYQFAYFCFMLKNYKEALGWTNRLINENYGTVREDIQSYARFMNMIIHFELNNVFVLRYAVESTRRFLKKKRELHNFEKVLLKFFSKISLSLPEKHNELFMKLRNDLFAKTDEKMKANVLDYLDFERWFYTKIIF